MAYDAARTWQLPDRSLHIPQRPLLMGIVNVTPDSFSDGGRFLDPGSAIEHARELMEEGADILDVGGESTRPGSEPISLSEELRRVMPVIEQLAGQVPIPLSIDTSKAEVARRCLALGVQIINDVTALRDPRMVDVAVEFRAAVIAMHMQGTPRTMQENPHYENVVREVFAFLAERIEALTAAGIPAERIVIDPGIGFGKTLEHNRQLISNLEQFHELKRPICIGHSRKRIIGKLSGRPVEERLYGTIGAALALCEKGVGILRVHEVGPVRDALELYLAITTGRPVPDPSGELS